MFNVASDCYLDKCVLRYDVLSGCSQLLQTNSHSPGLTCAIIVLCGSTAIEVALWRSWGDPKEAPRFVLKITCFGNFFLVMSWEPREIIPMWTEKSGGTKKEEMDVATGRKWTSYEWSQESWHAREYILNEYWQIFVDDRPVPRDVTNTQPKAVFSRNMSGYRRSPFP